MRDELEQAIIEAERRFKESMAIEELLPPAVPVQKVSIKEALQSLPATSIRAEIPEARAPAAPHDEWSYLPSLEATLGDMEGESAPARPSIASRLAGEQGLPRRRTHNHARSSARDTQPRPANKQLGVLTILGVIVGGALLAGLAIFFFPAARTLKGPTALQTYTPTTLPTTLPATTAAQSAAEPAPAVIVLTPAHCSAPAQGYTGIFAESIEGTWGVDEHPAPIPACMSWRLSGERLGNRVRIELENGASVWVSSDQAGEPLATPEPTRAPIPPTPVPVLYCRDSDVSGGNSSGHGHACSNDPQTAANMALENAQADLLSKLPTPVPFDPNRATPTMVIVQP